ncbi:MAG: helix-turn-helix transcriptional regulator [Mailhella sp.]|nr:helix-turn-helix transcriptional regulator [Mailhella sp.]
MPQRSLSEIFGSNVQRKRKQLGLTQEELSELLGVGQQSLSRIERGTMAPKFERLPDIARVLHCPVSELFIEEGRPDLDCTSMVTDILHELSSRERETVLRFVSEAATLFRSNRSENSGQ